MSPPKGGSRSLTHAMALELAPHGIRVNAIAPGPSGPPMSPPKGGSRSLTHAMALELAPHGIRVNAIAPGPTLTGLTRASYADPEKRAPRLRRSRSGQPEDIVGAILFLAADESR